MREYDTLLDRIVHYVFDKLSYTAHWTACYFEINLPVFKTGTKGLTRNFKDKKDEKKKTINLIEITYDKMHVVLRYMHKRTI